MPMDGCCPAMPHRIPKRWSATKFGTGSGGRGAMNCRGRHRIDCDFGSVTRSCTVIRSGRRAELPAEPDRLLYAEAARLPDDHHDIKWLMSTAVTRLRY